MLLTLTSTTAPATDLGYLLHKSPFRTHAFDLPFGKAHVFYPEADDERCTAALFVEVDPIGLVRGRRGPAGEGGALDQYVNDRPYAASSFLSVAIAEVFGSALAGRSRERPELAAREIPLVARLPVVPCRGGEAFLRRLFEPLGYEVSAEQHALDEKHPGWGPSRHFTVAIKGTRRLCDLLAHLYVLVPVLDDDKHYWVGDDEVDKLVKRGEGWLAGHPEREIIARRYCWPVASIDDLRVAPFHLLATEGKVHADQTHSWHLETLAKLGRSGDPLLIATSHRAVDVNVAVSEAQGIRWWEDLTGRGGEGMVVKPLDFAARGRRGIVQPAVKCRGPEYLRIIYGLEYSRPEHLERLRSRGLSVKRSLALREFALGIEGLERFVRKEPLRRVHECVFGVLALESEPVDPRL